MRFAQIHLFGVYVTPMSSMMVIAWVATIGPGRFAALKGQSEFRGITGGLPRSTRSRS